MNKLEYVAAVKVILDHDKTLSRIRQVSRDLAVEVGDDFGAIALVPETGMRRAYIGLLEKLVDDKTALTTYFIEEVVYNDFYKNNSSANIKQGDKEWFIKTAEDVYDALQEGF